MSDVCFDLNISVSCPLKDTRILNQTGNEPEIWFADEDNISDEFRLWLHRNDLVAMPALIFYTPPGGQCGIHIDSHEHSNKVAMNFIVGGDGSLMHWYKLKDDAQPSDVTETQAGTPYLLFETEQVELIHSQAVNWPSIVQVGIPHNVTNPGTEARWCLSYWVSKKENPEQGFSMEEAKEFFSQWTI